MLTDAVRESIVSFVKGEPRTVQDVARHIGKSWVTAESYCNQIAQRTGLVAVKTFRKGTQGALKLVYYNYAESAGSDAVHEQLLQQIKAGRRKQDFAFLDVYQFVPANKKHAAVETAGKRALGEMGGAMQVAEQTLHLFSGNLSFIDGQTLATMRELLRRGVHIRILCRVNLGTAKNIEALLPLLAQYPRLLEIRHCHQPLRGFITDNARIRAKDEESITAYREGELDNSKIVVYEVYDEAWVDWLQRVFWQLWRSSIDHSHRLAELASLRQ